MTDIAMAAPDEERLRADLRKVGLGARYHLKRFDALPQTEAVGNVKAWAMSPTFLREVFAGDGLSIHGAGAEAHDLFMVSARAAHLAGVKIKVISLSVLTHEVTGDMISTDLLEARALFVWPFYRPEYKEPLNGFQRLAVEEFLMDRMDNARALFTLSTGTLAECQAWWSSILIKRLQVTNIEVAA